MKVTSQNIDSNSFTGFLWELPLWLSLSYWSLLPDTANIKLEIFSLPINSKDLVLIAVAVFYSLLKAVVNPQIKHRPWNWHCQLPILTVVLLLYAVVSIEGSGLDSSNAMAMAYTLVLAASAFFLGFSLVAQRSAEAVHLFLWRLTIYLAALGLLYSAASFFTLGLGDIRANLNAGESDFGILRVGGPLFVSSTGHFILVPALAFSIQEFIQSHTQRFFKFSVIMALTLTIIGLGSRAALIVMGLFFLGLILFMKNKKQAIVAALIMIFVVSTATLIFSSKASTDRVKSFEDSARSDTYSTSFQIISHRSAELNITGSGYGSYWSWYLTDMDETQVNHFDKTPTILIYPLGYLLYHPHSTFLLCIVELGIPGLIYFATLWFILFMLLIRNFQSSKLMILKSGIFASSFSMFFDFFIFKGGATNLIWWVYLFGILALNSTSSKMQENKILIKNKNKIF